MAKAIIDTNIWISALMNSSLTRPVLNAFINGEFTPIVSDKLLKELNDTLNEPKVKRLIPANEAKELVALIDDKGHKSNPLHKIDICRDSKDNFLLSLIVETRVLLVTLDKDLLILSDKFDIIPPKVFLKRLRKE